MHVLYEDNHLLVIDKPPGYVTMGGRPGEPSVHAWARDYLKHKYGKPGNAYVGIVSRLDSEVSGVLVLARTSKAAGRLSEQIRQRQVTKRYLALVDGDTSRLVCGRWIVLRNFLRKNESLRRMEVVGQRADGAVEAILRVCPIAYTSMGTMVEIDLITGRKHQIRVQLANYGMPIRGDPKYGRGGQRAGRSSMRLHCCRVTIRHPTRKTRQTFRSWPTSWWPELPRTLWKSIEQRMASDGDDEPPLPPPGDPRRRSKG
ncbi:MAG: RNA pseudouridine synthase [Pirellulaceae bacterium]|nr:MAG: RNA pseudouridine synthase [Pirellulaceae bacterium]